MPTSVVWNCVLCITLGRAILILFLANPPNTTPNTTLIFCLIEVVTVRTTLCSTNDGDIVTFLMGSLSQRTLPNCQIFVKKLQIDFWLQMTRSVKNKEWRRTSQLNLITNSQYQISRTIFCQLLTMSSNSECGAQFAATTLRWGFDGASRGFEGSVRNPKT